MDKINEIEERINKIEERNKRVETNKTWETSNFRIGFITVITYVVTTVTFYIIGIGNPFLNALIPTIAFFLSVQALPIIKRWWVRRYIDREESNRKPKNY